MHLFFIVSPQTNPYWNVAAENYLVKHNEEDCVVLYLWRNRRTVVIGQNQNPFSECNVEALSDDGGYVMRRTTGGGAVYHDDGNINFSFVASRKLYDQSRQFSVIQKAVESFGMQTELSGRNDILVRGRKFSGNAFSKGKYNNLHHGTLLIKSNIEDLTRYLRPNPAKLKKHGVQSVASRVVNLSELNASITSQSIVQPLRQAFEEIYQREVEDVDFEKLVSQPEVVELYKLYSSEEWLFGKWRFFTASIVHNFDWGMVELSLEIDQTKNVIKDISIATDSLNVGLCDTVRSLLVGASSLQMPALPDETSDKEAIKDIFSLIY